MGVNIFLLETTNSVTYIKSHTYGNFIYSELWFAVSFVFCLDYMDNFNLTVVVL